MSAHVRKLFDPKPQDIIDGRIPEANNIIDWCARTARDVAYAFGGFYRKGADVVWVIVIGSAEINIVACKVIMPRRWFWITENHLNYHLGIPCLLRTHACIWGLISRRNTSAITNRTTTTAICTRLEGRSSPWTKI